MFEALLFVLCLNLACGLINASEVWTSSEDSTPQVTDEDDLTGQYNITNIESGWNPLYSIPIVGDIVKGFTLIYDLVAPVVFGFPILLGELGVPQLVVNILVGIFFFLMSVFLIEIISGRRTTD